MDINEKIEQLEDELAELKEIAKEQGMLKFGRTIGNIYYYIDDEMYVTYCHDWGIGDEHDSTMYEVGNYFYTRERAEEVAEKIKMLLKLERLHDTFCPNYVPDWSDKKEIKIEVFYNHDIDKWVTAPRCIYETVNNTYYPTEEIAQKVCEILNAEKGV